MTAGQIQSAIDNLKSSIHQKFAPKNPEQISGDSSAVAPPVPIPNTAVKRCSPDGSTAIGRARVGRRQNKMPGGLIHRAFSFLRPTRSTARRNAACRKRTSPRGSGEVDGKAL